MSRAVRRVGFFGGTFDPIHHGHLILASYACAEARLDRILVAPAAAPPHKDRVITPADLRVEMLLRAIEHDPRLELSTVDLDRDGPHYSADTLEILHRQLPDAELFFIMGSDSYRDLPSWHEPARMFDHAEVLVGRRPNSTFDQEAIWRSIPPARYRTHYIDIPLIEISSTDIRKRVREHRPVDYLVPNAVRDFIRSAGLYR